MHKYIEVVNSAFQDFEFPDKVIHLEKLDNNLFIAELFQGPTLAFKDLSLAILAKLLHLFLKKKVYSFFQKIFLPEKLKLFQLGPR